jgi:hypothetical protein
LKRAASSDGRLLYRGLEAPVATARRHPLLQIRRVASATRPPHHQQLSTAVRAELGARRCRDEVLEAISRQYVTPRREMPLVGLSMTLQV